MNAIILKYLNLKIFSEQDIIDYCLLNDINPDDIIYLDLSINELTDITGIKLFKNLEHLYLESNNISDISVLKNLKKLENLGLQNNGLTDISVLKYLKKLNALFLNNNNITDIYLF